MHTYVLQYEGQKCRLNKITTNYEEANCKRSMIRNISTKQSFADLVWNLFNYNCKLAKMSATKNALRGECRCIAPLIPVNLIDQ